VTAASSVSFRATSGSPSRCSGSPATGCASRSSRCRPSFRCIRDEFALNATQVGVLSSIPLALLGIAALVGSLLVSRLG
jgi:hypothetical protein